MSCYSYVFLVCTGASNLQYGGSFFLFCSPNFNPSSSTRSFPELNRGGKKYEKGTKYRWL